jgi:hypothetical protein
MNEKKSSRDYDAEIAEILKLAEPNHVQVPLMMTPQPDPLSEPTIKWVASMDEDDPHAHA